MIIKVTDMEGYTIGLAITDIKRIEPRTYNPGSNVVLSDKTITVRESTSEERS